MDLINELTEWIETVQQDIKVTEEFLVDGDERMKSAVQMQKSMISELKDILEDYTF